MATKTKKAAKIAKLAKQIAGKKPARLPVPKPSAKQQAASAARKPAPSKPAPAKIVAHARKVVSKIKGNKALAEMTEASRFAMPGKIADGEVAEANAAKKTVRKIKGKVAVVPAQPAQASSLVDLAKIAENGMPEFLVRKPGEAPKPAVTPSPVPSVSRETEPKALTVNPAAKQAKRDEATKAVAENGDKVVKVAPLTSGLHAKPPKPAKPAAGEPKPAQATAKQAKPKERSATGYDWSKAEALVKAGKLPPAPQLKSYGPHMQAVYEYAHKGDLKALRTYMENFKDEKNGRANLFRYARLCGFKS